jgi:cytochrome bd-type quinol oxidase subunit 2
MDGVGGGGGIRTTVRHFRREAAADKMHTDPSNIYGDSLSLSPISAMYSICFLYSLQRKRELEERAAFLFSCISFFLSLLLYFFSLYRAKKENDRLSIAYTQRATHK